MDGLRVERRGDALWLVLDRPEKRNALTLRMASTMAEALEDLESSVRCVVLTGRGSAFCAGGDAADLMAVAERGSAAVADVVYGTFQRLVNAVAGAPVPVIAGINGPAAGGGFDLALWCDLRLASTTATFRSTWISLGLVPGMGGATALTELVGSARAAELVLLGDAVDAATALSWGLVNDVVAPDLLEARLHAVSDSVARHAPGAVRRSKEALRRSRDLGLAAELATLSAVQATLVSSDTFRNVSRHPRTQNQNQ